MTINQKGSTTTRIPVNALNTLIEQVSDLQEDVGQAQNDIINLETGLGQTNSNVEDLQTESEPVFNKVTASVSFNGGDFNGNNATIDTINATTVNVGTIKIDSPTQTITAPFGNITEVDANTVNVTQTMTAKNVEVSAAVNAAIITTNKITNIGTYNGQAISGTTITASALNTDIATIANTATIKDVVISGTVSGLSDVELNDLTADSITTDTLNADKVVTGGTVMSAINHLAPVSPLLDNNDRYTIELPSFTGSMNLVWKNTVDDTEQTVWTATVEGNGKNYSVSWGTVGTTIKVTELFQYDGKLYIRTSSNGSLDYSYNTTKDLGEIHIYYNMGGWAKEKSLEELTELSVTHYVCDVVSGTFSFGYAMIPGLKTLGQSVFDNVEADKVTVNDQLILNGQDVQDLLDSKVSKGTQTTGGYVYARDEGTETQLEYGSNTGATIMSRDSNGRTKVADITSESDGTYVANKNYVDSAVKTVTDTKGQANGIASLDTNGRVPVSQMPTEALIYKGQWDASTGTYPVQETYTVGDFYIVSVAGDIGTTHFYVGDWIIWNETAWERSANANAVVSVNSKTGVVTLSASDVGALPSTYTAPVTSVNTKTGAVSLSASDVGALASSVTHLSGDVPTTRTVNSKALSSNITLTASDVGAPTVWTGTQAQYDAITTKTNGVIYLIVEE